LSPAERTQLSTLRATVRALAAAQTQAAADPTVPAVRVLFYDSTAFGGKGSAAIAFGDVDTADRIAWHVGGRGVSVAALGRTLDSVLAMHSAAAGSARDGGATASIAWVGYDAPAAKGRLRGLTLAGAREGAHLLLRDIASITASRSARAEDGARPRHTVLAHDYGVDVTEAAGRDGRLAGLADDIVLAGRPDDSRVLAHRLGDGVRVHAAAGGGPLYRTIGAQVPDGARPPGGVPTEALYRMEAVVAGHVGAAPHRPPDTGAATPERLALRRNNCVEPAMWRVAAQTGNPTLAT